MYNRRHESIFQIRRALSRDRLKYGVCVLALGGTLGFAASVSAQDNPVVDITDPNVSIDLTVLNDGGLSPQMGAPLSSTGATTLTGGAAFQAPGKDMPVSTLYVKPASGFKLPPQTKSIETKIVKVQAPEPVAAPESVEAAAKPAAIEPVEVATAPPPPPAVAPPAPASAAAEPPTPEPATPEPMAQHEPAAPVAEPSPVAEAAPEPAAPSSPEPATAVAALTPPPPPPMSAPEPTPQSQPMALKAEPEPAPDSQPQQAVAPTPPPAPTPAAEATVVAEHDETQTAPMSSGGNGVVIPLPPKPGAPAQVASLPPATGPLSDGDSLRIVFDAETSKLAQTARDALLDIATKMQSQDNLRLQLLAYAGDADTSASAARRLSLSRALAVRSFLIENGVRSTRIDVRALGNKSTEEATERVDITVVER